MAAGQIRAPIIIPLKPPHLTKTKNLTTEIKIDLISETADTEIYFTVNGSKPEPFKSIGDKNTFKFTIPFCLPTGKRTVKAIAISRDGSRESNIVTKVFEIEQIENANISERSNQQDVYGFLDYVKSHRKTCGDINYQDSKKHGQEIQRTNELNGFSGIHNPNLRSIAPQYLATRSSTNKKYGKVNDYFTGLNLESNIDMNDTLARVRKKKSENDEKNSLKLWSDTGYQSLRLQRETDFLKCTYCLAPRPTDSLAKFCNNCGQAIPPLPQSRLPPPESGQLGMCIHCRSTVPMNLYNCLVCEAPLNIQNQPQATRKLGERVLCSICGTANPPNMDSCLTCEAKLPESGNKILLHQPYNPLNNSTSENIASPDTAIMKCLKCGRQNNMDARYCDWCGDKSSAGPNSIYSYLGHLICSKCGANNHNNATYCCQCGNTMMPPPRQTASISNGINNTQWNSITLPLPVSNGILKPDNLMSQNSSFFVKRNSPCDVSTQTVGLFYPSTAQLKKNDEKPKPVPNNAWDKITPSLISPGKGYWRKQLDHIIGHLKAHSSNSAEFQALIGEPRMGKLISADVHEEDIELNITLTFALKGYKDPYQREISEEFDKRYLSSILKRTGSFDSFRSDDTLQSNEMLKPKKTPTTSSRCRSAKKKSTNKPISKSVTENILSDFDRHLLKEIGKTGEGRASEIERLFDEGADPKAKNGKCIPFITIAVRNKHKDAIRMLHKLGANINESIPESGNTPLHEAIHLGPSHGEIIEELLECGSSVSIKNCKGENPYDLAVKLNNGVAIKQLSNKIGKNQIEKLIQPKQLGNSDDEKI